MRPPRSSRRWWKDGQGLGQGTGGRKGRKRERSKGGGQGQVAGLIGAGSDVRARAMREAKTKGDDAYVRKGCGDDERGGMKEQVEGWEEEGEVERDDKMFDVGGADMAGPAARGGKKRSRRRQDMINRRKDKRGREGGDGSVTEDAWMGVRRAHVGDQEGPDLGDGLYKKVKKMEAKRLEEDLKANPDL